MSNQGNPPQRSRMMKFFGNPIVGVIGTIASLVGVGLGVWFFIASKRERDLTYFVHPVKSIVARAGETSALSITSNGRPVVGEVTTAQIAFWNRGSESIRSEHILEPFVIKTGVPILEARLRKTSRAVSGIALDDSSIRKGEITLSWHILEPADGGVVQLIFEGGIDTPITASAIIEGQQTFEPLEFDRKIQSPDEQYRSTFGEIRGQGYASVGIGVVSGGYFVRSALRTRKRTGRLPGDWWWNLVQSAFLIGAGIVFLLIGRDPGPPFGF